MNIRELRVKKGFTQSEAALYLGMKLRTYQNYEAGKSTRDNFKITQILKMLSEYEKYSETKGVLSIEQIKDMVKDVCDKHKVNYVYLFGSYSKGKAKDSSDIDLLIDCEEEGLNYLELMDELHTATHKNIDLIRAKDLLNNINFINEIFKTGVRIYG